MGADGDRCADFRPRRNGFSRRPDFRDSPESVRDRNCGLATGLASVEAVAGDGLALVVAVVVLVIVTVRRCLVHGARPHTDGLGLHPGK